MTRTSLLHWSLSAYHTYFISYFRRYLTSFSLRIAFHLAEKNCSHLSVSVSLALTFLWCGSVSPSDFGRWFMVQDSRQPQARTLTFNDRHILSMKNHWVSRMEFGAPALPTSVLWHFFHLCPTNCALPSVIGADSIILMFCPLDRTEVCNTNRRLYLPNGTLCKAASSSNFYIRKMEHTLGAPHGGDFDHSTLTTIPGMGLGILAIPSWHDYWRRIGTHHLYSWTNDMYPCLDFGAKWRWLVLHSSIPPTWLIWSRLMATSRNAKHVQAIREKDNKLTAIDWC